MSEFLIVLSKKGYLDRSLNLPEMVGEGVQRSNQHTLTLKRENLYLNADITPHCFGTIWEEEGVDPLQRSAVVTLGWCYRMDNRKHALDESDSLKILESHRQHSQPDVEILSGTYCLISFDHITESIWICTDIWALQSFYYG